MWLARLLDVSWLGDVFGSAGKRVSRWDSWSSQLTEGTLQACVSCLGKLLSFVWVSSLFVDTMLEGVFSWAIIIKLWIELGNFCAYIFKSLELSVMWNGNIILQHWKVAFCTCLQCSSACWASLFIKPFPHFCHAELNSRIKFYLSATAAGRFKPFSSAGWIKFGATT